MHEISIKILLTVAFLIGSKHITYGQNLLLNDALEWSYSDFMWNVLCTWNNNYRKKDIYFLNNYNPYGFDFSFLGNRWRRRTIIPLKKDTAFSSGLTRGKMYVGYPDIRVIGKDSLFIKIQMLACHNDGTSSWGKSSITFFRIENSGNYFKVLFTETTEQNRIYLEGEYKEEYNGGKFIDFYSIYPKAIRRVIDSLLNMGVPPQKIYIYDEYFPRRRFLNTNDSVKHITVGRPYKKVEEEGNYIIGWPFLTIEKGHVAVSMYCANKQWGEKRLIARVEYVFDDKAYRWKAVEEQEVSY